MTWRVILVIVLLAVLFAVIVWETIRHGREL